MNRKSDAVYDDIVDVADNIMRTARRSKDMIMGDWEGELYAILKACEVLENLANEALTIRLEKNRPPWLEDVRKRQEDRRPKSEI